VGAGLVRAVALATLTLVPYTAAHRPPTASHVSRGRHLPQLHNNPNVVIAAIVQRSEQPTAAAYLHTELESKTQLQERYKGVPMFSSVDELLADKETLDKIDGVIICTGHSMHAEMGLQFIGQGKNIFMEKPMTVDVAEARELASVAASMKHKVTGRHSNRRRTGLQLG